MLKKRRSLLFFLFLIFASCNAQNEAPKELKVKEIITDKNVTLSQVSELLEEQTELHSINIINWDTFSYTPKADFRIAHANNQIWLKYYVTEENILAQVDTINGGVAGDSCVEFFFDPKADGNYYNFEFSCIGMPHLAYGPGRRARQFVDEEKIKEHIEITSSLGNEPFAERTGGHSWEMTIIIPASILNADEGIQLKGLKTRANFYKCGDRTSERHYLSWNAVGTETPDFHRPEYFGSLVFE
ncbi:hypothetical protein FEE95_03865 [Maribacter algarum]|uniref:Carbohydrate-binding domain-containing protein n=1 Tax=Maribacter algarum (ex Zhang et al. 2020) TaxID=2578118 RepID=A0A5S3PU97_9FLAO|nr:carbohydrate-binding family 9-like protein [Maribacter algarum]TMM58576.1 hypothetical protein FEE95_03865 [Maribacter algarum]